MFIHKTIKSVIIKMNCTPVYLCFWLHYAMKFEMMCIHCEIESVGCCIVENVKLCITIDLNACCREVY